ncbi:MAG: GNAT family N-acetyltransferase [Hyphomonadaceae bacterium]|nr:GNAT family N-acetyltransferase [Hyphomonadaceae bacterium]
MSAPPLTVLTTTAEEEAAIRAAVREARGLSALSGRRVCAEAAHVDAALALLADPRVSAPIYDLPRPFTRETVAAWIEQAVARQARGEGILSFTLDERGEIVGYSDVTVWPDRASAEIGGAMRADRQSAGQGARGFVEMCDWAFDTIGIRLIGLTAALDNVRSQRMIDGAGFVRMGERDSVRPDGTVRRSVYWELTREAWRAMRARA